MSCSCWTRCSAPIQKGCIACCTGRCHVLTLARTGFGAFVVRSTATKKQEFTRPASAKTGNLLNLGAGGRTGSRLSNCTAHLPMGRLAAPARRPLSTHPNARARARRHTRAQAHGLAMMSGVVGVLVCVEHSEHCVVRIENRMPSYRGRLGVLHLYNLLIAHTGSLRRAPTRGGAWWIGCNPHIT